MLRIITGKYKGRRLTVPPKLTRPLTDRVRTTVFDLIRDFLPDATVLDLYAGSGVFGFEALSRGAESVDLVDGSKQAVKIIEENARTLEVQDQISVYPWKVSDFLKKNEIHYDIIFVDPPFPEPTAEKLEVARHALKLLETEGILILRLDSKGQPGLEQSGLAAVYEKKIGKSTVYFFRKPD
ncbi:MAG: 16S rRNA (guanine(966)-N(2))-methyltransferase RsmD [Candidatus Dojkabacteria bacterium]